MDYTRSPLRFRIRKVLRYVRLYGPSRTLAKVRGQYHMRTRYDVLPVRGKPVSGARHQSKPFNFPDSASCKHLSTCRIRCTFMQSPDNDGTIVPPTMEAAA